MKTSKAISTISFNSIPYLVQKLRELENAGILEYWSLIPHQPEDDEGGKKEHIHVYMQPAKMVQTTDIKEELKEYDPQNPNKPLGCINLNKSKWDDWYLYALHDPSYLAQKGQSRRYRYISDEFINSDQDEFLFKVKTIDLLSLSPYMDMQDAQSQGLTFAEYFHRGTIPLPQVMLYERAWNLMSAYKTERNGRIGHENENAPAGKQEHEPDGDLK